MKMAKVVTPRQALGLLLLPAAALLGGLWYFARTGGDGKVLIGSDPKMGEFLDFMATYSKAYGSEEEMARRFEIFKEILQKVEEHNAIYDKGSEFDLVLGINEFSDLTPQEFLDQNTGSIVFPSERKKARKEKRKLGGLTIKEREEAEKRRQEEAQREEVGGETIPKHKDWHAEGYVNKPLKQGHCGGCWAFAGTGVLEAFALIEGYEDKLPKYSEQYLLDCDESNDGCRGGWVREALAFVNAFGVLLQEDYNHYSESNSFCRVHQSTIDKKGHLKGTIREVEFNEIPNDLLKQKVAMQPVAVGFQTSIALQNYRRGIATEKYLSCSHGHKVNHGVVLIGYGSVHDGSDSDDAVAGGHHCKDYWILKNSWGDRWGEGGFFKVCADESESRPWGTCLMNRYTSWPVLSDAERAYYEEGEDDDDEDEPF